MTIMDFLLLIGLTVVAIASIIRDIRTRRKVAELREQVQPFAEITKAAIGVYESRRDRHDLMSELQAENNLIATVKELLKIP